MSLALPPATPENIQFVIDRLASSVVDTGGRQLKVRIGVTTVTWPGGAADSNTKTVTHGMGSTPLVAFAQPSDTNQWVTWTVKNVGATTLDIQLHSVGANPANTVQDTVFWLALG